MLHFYSDSIISHQRGSLKKSQLFLGNVVIDSSIFDDNKMTHHQGFIRQNFRGHLSLVSIVGKASLLVRDCSFMMNFLTSSREADNYEDAVCISVSEKAESAYIENSLFINNTGKKIIEFIYELPY